MPIQIVGNTNNSTAVEVEANTKAMRAVIRPNDYGSLGIYSVGATSGIMAAGLTAAAPVYSFRWGNGTNLAVLKKISVSAGNTSTAFAAGVVTFHAHIARGFTASDTGGTSILPSGNNNKLRTAMGTTLLTDLRISSTAALTPGTRTIDTQACGAVTSSIIATAGTPLLFLPADLFVAKAGDYPCVLAQNEGFVIQATVPGTGTWTFSVTTVWEELAAY